jgi:hypothetical protein
MNHLSKKWLLTAHINPSRPLNSYVLSVSPRYTRNPRLGVTIALVSHPHTTCLLLCSLASLSIEPPPP